MEQCGGSDISLAIETMGEVYSLHQKGQYILPDKTVLRWGDLDSEINLGRINSLSAYIGGKFKVTGTKWISNAPMNPQKYSMPRTPDLIILNNYNTLAPKSVMDGMLISATRTGADSGVAASYLAHKNSKTLGLVGAGLENRTQLLAMSKVLRYLKFVKVMDIDLNKAKEFSSEMSPKIGINIEVLKSPEEVIKNSDVFITATATKKPIVKYEWIKSGALYIHVGSHETEFEVVDKADKIIVDDWEKIKQRGVSSIALMHKDGKICDSNIYAQLGDIVNRKKNGRVNDHEFILIV